MSRWGLIQSVVDDTTIEGPTKLVLVVLVRHSWSDEESSVSQTLIANQTGLSKRCVVTCIKRLNALKKIHTKPFTRASRRAGDPNTYTLNIVPVTS